MTFDLQNKPLVGPLSEYWPGKTIRELPYRELRNVMAVAPEDWRAEAIAAASIGVELDELLNLPGRFSGAVANLLKSVSELHGLADASADEDAPINGTTNVENNAGKH